MLPNQQHLSNTYIFVSYAYPTVSRRSDIHIVHDSLLWIRIIRKKISVGCRPSWSFSNELSFATITRTDQRPKIDRYSSFNTSKCWVEKLSYTLFTRLIMTSWKLSHDRKSTNELLSPQSPSSICKQRYLICSKITEARVHFSRDRFHKIHSRAFFVNKILTSTISLFYRTW